MMMPSGVADGCLVAESIDQLDVGRRPFVGGILLCGKDRYTVSDRRRFLGLQRPQNQLRCVL